MHHNSNRRVSAARSAVVGLILAVAGTAAADTVDISSLLLYSENEMIVLQSDSFFFGAMAAKMDVDIKERVRTDAVYSELNISFGDDAVIRGRVLANDVATAGTRLDFVGSDFTGNTVNINTDATIHGDVQARSDTMDIKSGATVYGSLLGNRDVQVGDNSTIYGDASAGIGYDLVFGANVTVTGSTDPLDKAIAAFTLPLMPAEPPTPKAGKNNVRASAESTVNLAPGSYKDLSIEQDCVLNLSSGTYVFKSFWMATRGIVNVDTSGGDVVINVTSGFDTGQYVQFNPSGEGKVIINVYGNGGVWLGLGNVMKANMFVWSGIFGADKNLQFMGTILVKNNISIDEGAALYYSQGAGGYQQQAVPEPISLAMLAAGAAMMLLRRRRRHVHHLTSTPGATAPPRRR